MVIDEKSMEYYKHHILKHQFRAEKNLDGYIILKKYTTGSQYEHQ